jgi:hypothetical protein
MKNLHIKLTVHEALRLLHLLPNINTNAEFDELLTEIRTALDDASIEDDPTFTGIIP